MRELLKVVDIVQVPKIDTTSSKNLEGRGTDVLKYVVDSEDPGDVRGCTMWGLPCRQ
jgi:hypothetical protein